MTTIVAWSETTGNRHSMLEVGTCDGGSNGKVHYHMTLSRDYVFKDVDSALNFADFLVKGTEANAGIILKQLDSDELAAYDSE